MKRVHPITPLSLLVSLVLSLSACGPGEGTLRVTVYGEEFIEMGIPAEEFSDGWSVTFSRFLLSVGEITAASGHGKPALMDGTYRVFDLTRPSGGMGHEVLSAMVPGGAYDHLSYRLAAPGMGGKAGNATSADLDLMKQGGYSLYVEGKAVKEARTKTFGWGFTGKTRFAGCHSTAMVDGGTATSQITIHADHLFYDDLLAKEPNVSFELVARADTNMNGEVTKEELKGTDIRTEARYQVGSTGITDLWDFIAYQASTVGHIDGEGHCETRTRE